jgi:hypothetical protein
MSEDFDTALATLVETCLEVRVMQSDPFIALGELQNWVKRVQEAAEDMNEWMTAEDPNDYRGMGWVGKDGRP